MSCLGPRSQVHHGQRRRVMTARGAVVLAMALALTISHSAAETPRSDEPSIPRRAYTRLDVNHGLSQSSVKCLVQDTRGYIWIGTLDGLNRYDGHRFKVFRHNPEDPSSLADNDISALWVDARGTLWIGTVNRGLERYDPVTGGFVHHRHDPDDPSSLSHDRVWALEEDASGGLWVGTLGKGLSRLDPEKATFTRHVHQEEDPTSLSDDLVTALHVDGTGTLWVGTATGGLNRLEGDGSSFARYRHDPADPNSLANDDVRAIYEDRLGALWIGTKGGGLHRFDRQTGRFFRFQHEAGNPTSLSPENTVWALHEDRQGNFWVGTEGGGLGLFDRVSGRFLAFDRASRSDSSSLSHDAVKAIAEDRLGVLWVGTRRGVSRGLVTPQIFELLTHDPSDPESLGANDVWGIVEDRSGSLWIGTRGGGLDRLAPATRSAPRGARRDAHFRHDPDDPESLGGNHVWPILEDRDGVIWVGTTSAGLARYDSERGTFRHYQHNPSDPYSLSNNYVTRLYEDAAGTLWVGTFGGLNAFDSATETFRRYPSAEEEPGGLASDAVLAIAEDGAGALWVGTVGGGLARLDRSLERFTHYRNDPSDPSSLPHDAVTALYLAPSSELWVGTAGGGLSRFEAGEERFTTFGPADGLASGLVQCIVGDLKEDLWISTASGLSRFDPTSGEIRSFDEDSGLPSRSFEPNACWRTRSGELLFGSIDGLVRFDPSSVPDRGGAEPPPVVFTGMRIFNVPAVLGKPIEAVDEVRLTHRDRIVSFEVAALDFRAPTKNRYAYRLEGFDDRWIGLGTRRELNLTNLDPGDYVLRVRATGKDGRWNTEGASLRLKVLPPFWRTWWFMALAFCAIAGTLAWVVKARTAKVQARTQRLEEDLARRRRVQREREVFIAELETKNAEMARLLYTLSHDLRNPLVTIKGFVGVLEKVLRDPANATGGLKGAQHGVERIGQAADTLARLIDDLLKFSRIGHLTNPSEEIELVELVREVVKDQEASLHERGSEIDVPADLPWVVGDRPQLRRVFEVLLDNAITYMGDQANPRVEVAARRSGDVVICQVRDNGIGIDARYHEKIFGLFDRLVPDGDGTGVGLTLARRIVEAHGGRIWVESEGRGSTFFVLLPAAGTLRRGG